MNRRHNRFKDAPWYLEKKTYAFVGGAGGIGSWVALLLSRMGVTPIVYDADLVEEHNLGGQAFFMDSIGLPKVAALERVVKNFSGESMVIIPLMIDENTKANNNCFSAFDNIAARKLLFERWLGIAGANGIFIDGRLEAEQMWIYCIRRDRSLDIEAYRAILNRFNDETLEEAACTFRQTSHAAAMIASHMVAFFTNHLVNIDKEEELREVPFRWEYFIPANILMVD